MADNTVKLQITLSPNGEVSVTGPIENAMLCYGLLEAAKDVIRNHVQKKAAAASPIVMPGSIGGPLLRMPGNGRR